MGRSALAILSTENLLHNLAVIRAKAPDSKVIAMVKANAYGHGIRSVSMRIAKYVDLLGVASIDEALALRKVGVKIPILLIEGVFDAQELLVASTERFHVVFHDDKQLEWLHNLTCPLPIQAWIKVDTGMGRLGFHPQRSVEVYAELSRNTQIAKPIRLMSHMACTDEQEHPLNALQIKQFKELTSQINTEYSLANSGAIFKFADIHYDYVRPGIALYGASPLQGVSAAELGLKPVMTVQTSLIAAKQMCKGENIGYGARYACPEDMPVGIVAFGYGDGYPRNTRDGAPILVNNIRCQLVGRVSMDMIAVDLRPCPSAKVGDPVVLWGTNLPIEEVAAYTENISYDLLTGVQNRVKFLWTQEI